MQLLKTTSPVAQSLVEHNFILSFLIVLISI